METALAHPGGLAEPPPLDATASAGSGRPILHTVDVNTADEGGADKVPGGRRERAELKTMPASCDETLDTIQGTGDSYGPIAVRPCAWAAAAKAAAVAAATANVDVAVRAADGSGEALAGTPMDKEESGDGNGGAGAGGPSGKLAGGTTAGTPPSGMAPVAAATPASAPAVASAVTPAVAGTPAAAGTPVSAATNTSGAASGGAAQPQTCNRSRRGGECKSSTYDVPGLHTKTRHTSWGGIDDTDGDRGDIPVPPSADANAVKLLAVAPVPPLPDGQKDAVAPVPPLPDGQKDAVATAVEAATDAATAVMAGNGGSHRVVADLSAKIHGAVTMIGQVTVPAADEADFDGLSFVRVLAVAKARVVSAEAAVAAAGPSVGEFRAAIAALEVTVTSLETIVSCARRCRALQRMGEGGVEGQEGPPSVKRART
ncbi:hypothetical protein MMPV_005521 [Pyropia vietnamensis]